MSEAILKVEKLKKYFPLTKGILSSRNVGYIKAVDEIDFSIQSGETFTLVGESGCGKSTTAYCVLKVHRPTSGTIRLGGQDIASFQGAGESVYRKSIQAVFQDPYSSLSPRLKVRSIIAEPLKVNTSLNRRSMNDRISELIAQVGLPAESPDLYPHEFSGGQRQRIALARALALSPKLIVLDEPVSALDVSIRAQVMNLLKDLQQRLGVAYLLIAHSLADVRYMSHRIGVMYLGKIVEFAAGEELFTNPLHPYTQALISAALPSRPNSNRKEITLSGEVPSPASIPSGCRFHTRCFRKMDICSEEEPAEVSVDSGHVVACHLYGK